MIPHPAAFVATLLESLRAAGLDPDPLPMDHICYRVSSLERYTALRSWLGGHGELLQESRIGGRPIAVFRLREAYVLGERQVAVVELPAPKAGSAYAEGWEHAEFVVADPLALLQRYPQLAWDVQEMRKAVNPSLRLRCGNLSAKFHGATLETVIAQEKAGAGTL